MTKVKGCHHNNHHDEHNHNIIIMTKGYHNNNHNNVRTLVVGQGGARYGSVITFMFLSNVSMRGAAASC